MNMDGKSDLRIWRYCRVNESKFQKRLSSIECLMGQNPQQCMLLSWLYNISHPKSEKGPKISVVWIMEIWCLRYAMNLSLFSLS